MLGDIISYMKLLYNPRVNIVYTKATVGTGLQIFGLATIYPHIVVKRVAKGGS